MHTINRAAIVVRPKSPFFAWAQALKGGLPESIDAWASVYLVAVNEDDQLDKIVRRCFGQIFEEQLEAWHRVEDDWPMPRTFSLFQQWFDADVVDLVFDLSDQPIEHDD